MIDVSLSWAEMQHAVFVGCQRRLRSISRGRVNRFDPPEDVRWGIDVHGACAELAVAKLLGAYWGDSSEPDSDGDIGGYFVRSTLRLDGGLILHRDDVDDRVFVLVCGSPPHLSVAGWLLARDGKQARFWRSDIRAPAFIVPQRELHDADDLTKVAAYG